MATTITLLDHLGIARHPYRGCDGSGAVVVSFASSFHGTACAYGMKLYSQCSFVHVTETYLVSKNERMTWQIKSSVDSRELDPLTSGSSSGGTRLVRAIQSLQIRIGARVQEIRKNLPTKLLFFLVGIYCATAFATVIGQTGDWDILSAALALAIVEGIGALMYKASFQFLNKMKDVIAVLNYWKVGLSLGLFLDSFKY